MRITTIEAPSPAAFARTLLGLPHETRGVFTATERGESWATVDVSPMTDTARSVFPTYRDGVRGDTRKRGQSGVMVQGGNARDALGVVIERARRMHRD